MPPEPYQFCNLDTVVDEVHALFEVWAGDGTLTPPLDDFSIQVMKMAVHEWIANLVQHADFDVGAPEIAFAVTPNGRRVRCVIEDNSAGFNFEHQVKMQQVHVQSASGSERGRGLLMMIACTEDLQYAPPPASQHADGQATDRRQRLEFWISANPQPCLDIPF